MAFSGKAGRNDMPFVEIFSNIFREHLSSFSLPFRFFAPILKSNKVELCLSI